MERPKIKKRPYWYILLALLCLFVSCDNSPVQPHSESFDLAKRSDQLRGEKLKPEYECQKNFFRPFITGNGEGKMDKGQSFKEYVDSHPNRPSEKRDKIYILLLGEFTDKQLDVLDDTIKYMEVCFALPVKKLASFPIKRIQDKSRRQCPQYGQDQLNATDIIKNILLPNRPDDAVALIGFTSIDLFPSEDINYVFGLSSLTNRIGIWSIYRNGNPDVNEVMYKQCLRRTISTAVHQTGHILGIHHCIAYECVMSQRDSMIQKDLRGIHFCPSCQQKLNWAVNSDPAKRIRNLMALCSSIGLDKEAQFFGKSLEHLRKNRVKK